MKEVFLPTLHSFAMKNIFTGSCGLFRFRAEPKVVMLTPKEVNFEESSILWNTGMASIAMKRVKWKEVLPSP